MENEIGANPWQGYQDAEIAEHLAEAMDDLPVDFNDLINEIKACAGEKAQGAYEEFRDNLEGEIRTVQENGASLANQIMAGAGDIVDADNQGSDGYEGAWRDIPEPRF